MQAALAAVTGSVSHVDQSLQLYMKWEAADYPSDTGDIYKDDLRPEGERKLSPFFMLIPKLERVNGIVGFLLAFAYSIFLTIWNPIFAKILRYFSRAASGIPSKYQCPENSKHITHGYFGWGMVIMLQPEYASERFKDELINISVVAALLLNLTLPLFANPEALSVCNQESESGFNENQCNQIHGLYVFLTGAAVGAQITVASTSVLMITCLNKCLVKKSETGNLLIKSLFNPDNGLTGFIGPALYMGVMVSYACTIWMSLFLVFSNHQHNPKNIWVVYLFIVFGIFGVYFLALFLAQAAELKIKNREVAKVGPKVTDLDEYIKAHSKED